MNAIDGTSETEEAYDRGYAAGYDTGFTDGYDDGYAYGYGDLRGKLFDLFLRSPVKVDWEEIFNIIDDEGEKKNE